MSQAGEMEEPHQAAPPPRPQGARPGGFLTWVPPTPAGGGSSRSPFLFFWCVALAWPLAVAVCDLVAWEGVPFEWEGWYYPLALFLLWPGFAWWARRRGVAALPVRTLWCLLGLGALYNLTGNLCSLASPLHFPVSAFMAAGALCLLGALLGRWALLFWLPFMLLEQAQMLGHVLYGSRINSLVLAETFEASAEEAQAYLTPVNIGILALMVAFVLFLCYVQRRVLRPLPRLRLIGLGLFFCLLSCLFGAAVPPHRQTGDNYWPFYEVVALSDAYDEAVTRNVATVQLVESLPSPADAPSALPTLRGGEGVVLILHVGESVRADRMGINGYGRDTTPWLSAQQRAGRLISFTDCISAACDTCQAQIAILTDARRGIAEQQPPYAARAGSVLDLFAARGFGVYSFFGRRCAQQLKYDRVVRLLTRCSRERFYAPGPPWTVLPQLHGVLEQGGGENLVLFINNEGSHTPFDNYDPATAPFQPAETDFSNPSAHAQEVNNAYDNTIHYTDEFIRRIAERLQGRPFAYLYVSDHGEYLGHEGLWGRAGLGGKFKSYHSTDGCRVGMFLLTSPEFESLHPHFAEAVARLRAHAGMRVGHEHVYHTLLGLVGLQSPYYDPALDLASPEPAPYGGPAPDAQAKP